MRMRRKKNLIERLKDCESVIIDIHFDIYNLKNTDSINQHFNCEDVFGNNNPVHLEIGCGKGQFVCEMAKLYPDINFLAVEKEGNVIVAAAERALSENLTNVKFIKQPAEFLDKYFPESCIERIYLNFSCPFPKKRYEKHRLTHEIYLNIYKKILKPNCEIHMKTDNTGLFEFSINSLSGFGFTLKNVTFDLHNSGFEGNIVTEYEHRFSSQGFPIYRLEAYLKQ